MYACDRLIIPQKSYNFQVGIKQIKLWMVLIKMLSAYRENILILSEHVQILEQIFDSEVIRNYLYLSNLPKWVKKEELHLKEERYIWTICKYYWMGNYFGKMTGVFCFHYLQISTWQQLIGYVLYVGVL